MHRAGVNLMGGTDLGVKWVAPGVSLHDEMALLVDAGLTPMEALQTATVNPARFLGVSAGTVEPGKIASLVLLDANPLENIRNTTRIHAVILGENTSIAPDWTYYKKPGIELTLFLSLRATERHGV